MCRALLYVTRKVKMMQRERERQKREQIDLIGSIEDNLTSQLNVMRSLVECASCECVAWNEHQQEVLIALHVRRNCDATSPLRKEGNWIRVCLREKRAMK